MGRGFEAGLRDLKLWYMKIGDRLTNLKQMKQVKQFYSETDYTHIYE